MRLFVALPFEQWKTTLDGLQAQLPKEHARLRLPSHYHLTLKFLGEVEGIKIEHIKTALKGIRFAPFDVTLSEIGVFPDWKRINIVWIGVENGEMITRLQQQIEGFLSPWFGPDERFHPYVTIARVKNVHDKPAFVRELKSIDVPSVTCKIDRFHLMASELTPEGARYHTLETYEA